MLLQAIYAADQGRLARAGGAADNDALAFADCEVDVFQYPKLSVVLIHLADLNCNILLVNPHRHRLDNYCWPTLIRRSRYAPYLDRLNTKIK
ncbi:hypothetical protein D9M69_547360 [compost metagenome]